MSDANTANQLRAALHMRVRDAFPLLGMKQVTSLVHELMV